MLRRAQQEDRRGLREGDAKFEGVCTFGAGVSAVKRYVASPREGRPLAPKKRPSSRPKLDEGARKLLETDLEERRPLRCCTVAAQGVETDCKSPVLSPHSTCKPCDIQRSCRTWIRTRTK